MRFLKWACGVALFCLLLVFSISKLDDINMMQSLADGKIIFTKGLYADFCSFNYVPHACQLSYAHEWFFNFIAYATYLIGKWNALNVLQVATVVSIFAIVAVVAKVFRYSFFSTSVFVFLAILVSYERFTMRADLFGMLLAVTFYAVFRFHIENKLYERKDWHKFLPLALLFVLQLIWANTHGSFLYGFAIVLAYIAAYVVQYLIDIFVSEKEDAQFLGGHVKALLTVFVVVLIASVLNIYGPRVFINAFNTSPAQGIINEWQSPFSPQDARDLTVTIFTIVLGMSVAILLANFKKLFLADVFIALMFAFLSVRYVRFMALFTIFCAMILPYYLDNIINFCRQRFSNKAALLRGIAIGEMAVMVLFIGVSVYLIPDVLSSRFYLHKYQSTRFGMGLSVNELPEHAASFIESNYLQGNMFTDDLTGQYFNWRLYPARKTFADGYTFSPDSLAYYHNIMAGNINYNTVAKQYHINYFVLEHTGTDAYALIPLLYADKNWKLIYFDEQSVIFIANTPENQAIIKKYAVNFQTGKNYDPDRLPTYTDPNDTALGFTSRGYLLGILRLPAYANYQFQKAIATGRQDYHAYSGLGITYSQLNHPDLALDASNQAVKLAPNVATNHYYLGTFYANQAQYDQAISELKKALSLDKNLQGVNLAIGVVYAKQGDTAKGKIYLQKEVDLKTQYSSTAQKDLSILH